MARTKIKKRKKTTSQLEWLQGRQGGVGSSDSPVLALPSGELLFGKNATDVFISKKAPIKEDNSDQPQFRRGHTYEPLAILLAEKKLGMKIYAPKTDNQRWNDYQVWHPKYPFMFADFDGLREDGWVVEVKSPMQRVADRIKNEGLKDYYQVQGQHLVECASVCKLPNLGRLLPTGKNDSPDGCPGVCFVIYECEKVEVQIYEIPRNDSMIGSIIANAKHFWLENVQKGIPPEDAPIPQPIKVKGTKAKYSGVDGEGWDEATRQFLLADEAVAAAKKRLDVAKDRIVDVLQAVKLKRVITASRHKFSYTEQAGASRVDMRLLQADHPTLDLEKYKRRGSPFSVFRHYGPKDEMRFGDETLDGQLLTLRDELVRFSESNIDDDLAVELLDELRARTDLYTGMLSLELEGLEKALAEASNALITRLA